MAIPGLLNHTIAILLIVVGLLSGALSVVREVQLMYLPAKAQEKRLFWAFVRIAFVVAAILLWADEREKVGQLSGLLKQNHTHIAFLAQNSLKIDGVPTWPYKDGDIPITAIGISDIGSWQACTQSSGEYIFVPISDFKDSDKMFSTFVKSADYIANGCLPPNPSYNASGTYKAPQLSAKDVENLEHRNNALCIVGRVKWKDDSGCYASDYGECQVAEPGSPSGRNWHVLKNNMKESSISCEEIK